MEFHQLRFEQNVTLQILVTYPDVMKFFRHQIYILVRITGSWIQILRRQRDSFLWNTPSFICLRTPCLKIFKGWIWFHEVVLRSDTTSFLYLRTFYRFKMRHCCRIMGSRIRILRISRDCFLKNTPLFICFKTFYRFKVRRCYFHRDFCR